MLCLKFFGQSINFLKNSIDFAKVVWYVVCYKSEKGEESHEHGCILQGID